ncbi:MAG: hypothetical protein IJZ68_08380 [Bacteroidaceae bacterium]|nr:hypothetical protein [Bacteroidaceae bacterium]
MRCFECESFREIGNTAETGCGLCAFSESFSPVHQYDECHYRPGELKCIDCDRFGNDTACMTCAAEDSAYHDGHLCAGFIDRNETVITNALMKMRMRGVDYHAKIQELLKEVDDAKLPGQPRQK